MGTVVVLLALVGCGSSADVSPEDLEGPTWTVVEGMNVDVPGGATPTAEFSQGQLSGFSGCNTYQTSYDVDGDTMTIGEVAGTLIACDEPTMAVETDYVASLKSVQTWTIENDHLLLQDGEGDFILEYSSS
jgi:heat shock protein HslJ